jgi:hypothetical protein
LARFPPDTCFLPIRLPPNALFPAIRLCDIEQMRGNRSSFTAIVAGALILAGKVTMAQTAVDDDLIDLAKKHFGYESIPNEEKNAFCTFLFYEFQTGRTDNQRGIGKCPGQRPPG